MRPVINRGEIWWAAVPDDKVRPVVVLTRQRFTGRLNRLVVAPITSSVRGIPSEVALGLVDGLEKECVVNCDNLATVQRSSFRKRITRLDGDRMTDVCRAYRFAVGC